MNIPNEAIEAAAKEIWKTYVGHDLAWFKKFGSAYDRHRAEETAKAALEAALPHIRAQIASKLRAKGNAYPVYSERRGAWNSAARTVEEGTF